MEFNELKKHIISNDFRSDYNLWHQLVSEIINIYKIPLENIPKDRVPYNLGIINEKPFIELMDYKKTEKSKTTGYTNVWILESDGTHKFYIREWKKLIKELGD